MALSFPVLGVVLLAFANLGEAAGYNRTSATWRNTTSASSSSSSTSSSSLSLASSSITSLSLSSSSTSSVTDKASSSTSSGGIGIYIQAGFGLTSSSSLSSSSSSSQTYVTAEYSSIADASSSTSSALANNASTTTSSGISSPAVESTSHEVFPTSLTFSSVGTAATGFSPYTHDGVVGSASVGYNASATLPHTSSGTSNTSSTFAYSPGISSSIVPVGFGSAACPTSRANATASAASTAGNSSSLMSAFSMPSSDFGGYRAAANASGLLATGTASGTGPITSTGSSPFTVPAFGNGSSYDWACNSEWSSYQGLSSTGISQYYIDTTIMVTAFSASLTTLCDGHTRVVGDLTPVSTWASSDSVWTSDNYTGSPPSCSINNADCASMYRQHATETSSFNSVYSSWLATADLNVNHDPPDYAGAPQPVCIITGSAATQSDCGACTIWGGSVELMYFPVTTNASRNMCATTLGPSTVCPYGATLPGEITNSGGQATEGCSYYPFNSTSAAESGPYMVSAGATFYQNRVYMSYATAYATNTCGTVGSVHAGGLLTLESSDIYSVSGFQYKASAAAYPVNFADNNDPIPWSAFYANRACHDSGYMGLLQAPNLLNNESVPPSCATDWYVLYAGNYQPVLAVPPQFRAIDPAWENCLLALDGLFDPPYALQPASSAAGPTTPGGGAQTTTTPASPASTPNSPAATTAAPSTTPPPAESDNQGSTSKAQSQGGDTGGVSLTSKTDGGSGPGGQSSAGSGDAPGSSDDGGNGASPTSQGSGGSGGGSSQGSGNNPSSNNNGGSQASSAAGTGSGGSSGGDGGGSSQGGTSGAGQTTAADPGGIIVSVIQASSTAGAGNAGTTQGSGSSESEDSGSGSSGSGEAGSGSDPDVSATVVVGSSTFTVAPGSTRAAGSSSAVVVAAGGSTATLEPGQTTSIGGQAVSAASSGGGAVIGSGGSATSVSPGSGSSNGAESGGGTTVASVGSSAFTVVSTQLSGSSAIIVANGGSTATLALGQSTSLGGQVVGAPSSGGVIVGTGSAASTTNPDSSNEDGSGVGDGSSVVSVGSSAFTVATAQASGSSVVVVANGGSTVTLAPGATTTLGGQIISAPSSGSVVVGTGSDATAANLGSSGSGGGAIATVAGQVISTDPLNPSNVVVGGSTLAPGQTGTISGTLVSVASGSIVVSGSNGQPASTIAIPSASANGNILGNAQTTVDANGCTLTAVGDPSNPSVVIVDGSSITLGGSAQTIDGLVVSLASSGLVADGSLVVTASPTPLETFTVNGQTYTVEREVGDGKTSLVDGSSAATLDRNGVATLADTTISLGAGSDSSFAIIDGSKTVPLSPITPVTAPEAIITLANDAISTAPLGHSAVLTLSGQVLTAIEPPGTDYIILDGTTLRPGQSAKIDDVLVSDANGRLVVGGSKTVPLTPIPTISADSVIISANGQYFTAIEPKGASFIIVGGTTLYIGGPALTIDGIVVSDSPSGLVFDKATISSTSRPSTTAAPGTSAGGGTAGPTSSTGSGAAGVALRSTMALAIAALLACLVLCAM